MSSIEVNNLHFNYVGFPTLLRDVSTIFTSGNFTAILGVNGSGKSTLLSCLDGMYRPSNGCILLNEKYLNAVAPQERAQEISYVTQHAHANASTVYEALLLGRKPYMQGSPRQEDFDIVDQAIEEFGLKDYYLRHTDELSGGEYQKVVLARAFVQQPNVLLLDEPTNNLDLANQIDTLKIVEKHVTQNNLCAVVVLHDINLALRFCNRFIFLKDGAIYAEGDAEIITQKLVHDVYSISCDIIKHDKLKVIIPQ